MQIVRDLAGYSYGRSDLVRRAMSKKKASVMEQERKNFVYGKPEEGVKGCIANGIPEEVAMKIFDEMTDFARYAFNKSHAAAYAVVAYRTAYLKKYYPIEFMAALMTSVMDRTDKIASYIMNCRQMGIEVMSPSINNGIGDFSTSDKGIIYGLSAIKSVGRPVIDAIVAERANGPYTDLSDFVNRLSGKEVNKRTVENFIKAGAFDELGGNRKQKMLVYTKVIDDANNDRKSKLTGQMSLFEFADSENEDSLKVVYPNVEEYEKEELLGYEKEVLGIYVSGHPLDEYQELLESNITNTARDFQPDDETGIPEVKDNATAVIGGMIIDKRVMTTSKGDLMAFVTLEDLYGVIEVIIFPRDFAKYKGYLNLDAKVFISGRVSVEEDKPAKLISSRVTPFDELPKHLWLQFENKAYYTEKFAAVNEVLFASDGCDSVSIYLATEKAVKHLPISQCVNADAELVERLQAIIGEENVRVTQKRIEKTDKR